MSNRHPDAICHAYATATTRTRHLRADHAHYPWLPALILCGLAGMASPALADGPLRGNPLDGLPDLERPAQPPPATRVAPPVDAQEAVRARLQQRIVPRHFDVRGGTALAFEEINAILGPLTGRETTIGALAEAVNQITALYQRDGYLLSFALLQHQDFAGGRVVVTLVEGHISGLEISGEPGSGAAARLQSLAQPLIAEKPLTRATLERVLNLMRMVPGVRFTTTLDLPQRADGATTLALKVDHRRAGLSGGVADLGTGTQAMVNASIQSLTPLGEQVKLTAALPTASRSVRYVAGTVTVPVGRDGLSIELDGYHYRSQPRDAVLESLGWNRQVTNNRLGITASYPFLLDNQQVLTGSLGFYAMHATDQYHRAQDNAWLRQETKLRVARVGLRYAHQGERLSGDIQVAVHKGVDGLGASRQITSNYGVTGEPVGDLSFVRYTAHLKQTLKLPAGFGLTLSAAGQYSSNALPNSEQISFGAWRYGLGYRQGELAGDKGYGVSLELNRKFDTPWKLVRSIQPYIIADHARAWYNSPVDPRFNGRRLSSVGAGFRLTDDRFYLFDINVAKPVGPLPLDGRRRDFRINANYTLFYDGL